METRNDVFIVMTPFMEIHNNRMKVLLEKGFKDGRKMVSSARLIEKGIQPLLLVIDKKEKTYFLYPDSICSESYLYGLLEKAKIPIYSKNAFEKYMKTVI